MNKGLMLTGLGMVVAAGVAGAGTLEGMARWADRTGPDGVADALSRRGASEAQVQVLATNGWDEAGTVTLLLEGDNYRLLDWIGRMDRFSRESAARIRDAIRDDAKEPLWALGTARHLPLDMRREIEPALKALVDRVYAETPAFGRFVLEYRVMRELEQWDLQHTVTDRRTLFGPEVAVEDFVRLLLAPEPMAMRTADQIKRAISDATVRLARAALRASGESFVVRDGVNPLTEAVRPVVEALNAPGCAGLEAALRELGADVPDLERDALEALAADWQAAVMAGEMEPREIGNIIGKLSVALGVEGFNAFVDAYNHGTAGGGGHDAR